MTRHRMVLIWGVVASLILGLWLAGPALDRTAPSPQTVGTRVAPQ